MKKLLLDVFWTIMWGSTSTNKIQLSFVIERWSTKQNKSFFLSLSLVSNLITFFHLLDLSDSQYNFFLLPKEINLWSTLQQFFSLLFCANFYDVGNQLQNRTGTTLKIIYFLYTLRDIEDECNFVFTSLSDYYFPSFLFFTDDSAIWKNFAIYLN